MVLKVIDGTEAKVGVTINIEGAACIVRSMDISKTGKHGHAKVRLEAIGILDGKKRCVVVPGHERFEVPLITKMKGQVLSVGEEKASIMDLESFETLDVAVDPEIKNDLKEGDNVEYWDVEGTKIVKRKN
ncbi:translation initiation factor IF-5A [Candidatus Pacearchaeota archaeon]|nr:translation initiation factor IF-5A [Candidatus Pacearchaeota archaeon]